MLNRNKLYFRNRKEKTMKTKLRPVTAPTPNAVSVGLEQLPAFFKFQVAGQRKNMKSALALQPNVAVNCKKRQKTG